MNKLRLIIVAALCFTSAIQPMGLATKVFQAMKNNKILTVLCVSIPSSSYSLFREYKIAKHAQTINLQNGLLNQTKTYLSNLQEQHLALQQQNIALQKQLNNTISPKQLLIGSLIVGICGCINIHYKYQDFLKNRPTIHTIFKNASTKEDAAKELRKNYYTKTDFAKCVFEKSEIKFTNEDMKFIISQLV